MGIEFQVTGGAELAAALEEMAAALLPLAAQGMAPALEAMAREARGLAPADTGGLRASIGAEPPALEEGGVSARVRARADHAATVELGAKGRPPQPFLYPAYQAHKEALLRAVAASIQEGLP